jgi:hypothetical protein
MLAGLRGSWGRGSLETLGLLGLLAREGTGDHQPPLIGSIHDPGDVDRQVQAVPSRRLLPPLQALRSRPQRVGLRPDLLPLRASYGNPSYPKPTARHLRRENDSQGEDLGTCSYGMMDAD